MEIGLKVKRKQGRSSPVSDLIEDRLILRPGSAVVFSEGGKLIQRPRGCVCEPLQFRITVFVPL